MKHDQTITTLALLLLLSFSIVPICSAEVWYVRATGSDSNSGLSWSDPYATLFEAHESMTAGDTIVVASGDTLVEKATFLKSAFLWPIEEEDSLSLHPSNRHFLMGNIKASDHDDFLVAKGAGVVLSVEGVTLLGNLDGSGVDVIRTHLLARDGGSIIARRILGKDGMRALNLYQDGTLDLKDARFEGVREFAILVTNSNGNMENVEFIESRGTILNSRDNRANHNLELVRCTFIGGENGFVFNEEDSLDLSLDHCLIAQLDTTGIQHRGAGVHQINNTTFASLGNVIELGESGRATFTDCIVTDCDSLLMVSPGASLELIGVLLWSTAVPDPFPHEVEGQAVLGNPNFISSIGWGYRPGNGPLVRAVAVASPWCGAVEPVRSSSESWGRPGWSKYCQRYGR
ncbi:hypothetical protein KQI63_14500 [bacterium]|nr:hypothetical protein [bacterium]